MNNKIKFINAENGGIQFTLENGINSKPERDPRLIKHFMVSMGFADDIKSTSSMDFADEHGFKEKGDAWKLFEKALSQ